MTNEERETVLDALDIAERELEFALEACSEDEEAESLTSAMDTVMEAQRIIVNEESIK